jgi:hypothetical protein
MTEKFHVEAVLRELLEVLRRHDIPIETASLNVSLLDAAFDEQIPQLKTYKAGRFVRHIVVNKVPVLFRAQRRYPFDEIVRVLERELRPRIEALAKELRQEYPDLKMAFISQSVINSPDSPASLYLYRLGIKCQFSDDVHADYNELDLMVLLQQLDATAYPHLTGWVGWLVDEESGGDWGLDIVYRSITGDIDYAPHEIGLLNRALPSYFKCFREQIVRKRSGDLAV